MKKKADLKERGKQKTLFKVQAEGKTNELSRAIALREKFKFDTPRKKGGEAELRKEGTVGVYSTGSAKRRKRKDIARGKGRLCIPNIDGRKVTGKKRSQTVVSGALGWGMTPHTGHTEG